MIRIFKSPPLPLNRFSKAIWQNVPQISYFYISKRQLWASTFEILILRPNVYSIVSQEYWKKIWSHQCSCCKKTLKEKFIELIRRECSFKVALHFKQLSVILNGFTYALKYTYFFLVRKIRFNHHHVYFIALQSRLKWQNINHAQNLARYHFFTRYLNAFS